MAADSRASSTTQKIEVSGFEEEKKARDASLGVDSKLDSVTSEDNVVTACDPGKREETTTQIAEGQESCRADLNQETWRQSVLLAGLLLAAVIISIDGTIIVTAVPAITEQFDSIEDVGWYGSVYTLGLVIAQPVLGSLYRQLNAKYVLWASLLVFTVGSVIAATAKQSYVLIIGRGITGAGGSGLFTGSLVIANLIGRGRKKPLYIGLICSTYGVGCAAGPLIGGAFTDSSVTWRFCFWVNLPIALVTFLTTSLYQNPKHGDAPSASQVVKRLDLLGLVPLTIWLVCLLLGISYAGTKDEASHRREVGLLVGFAVAFLLFLAQQRFLAYNSDQILSFRIIKIRTVACCAASELLFIMVNRIQNYYLPIYFQVVKSASPLISGVYLIPYLGAMAVSPIIAGIVAGRVRHPQPLIWLGLALLLVGSGLMYTLDVDTALAFNFGAQVLSGFGLGLAIQTVITTMQAAVPGPDVPLVTSLHVFCISLGPTIGLAVAQDLLISQLSASLRRYGVDPAPFVQGAALATPQVLDIEPMEAAKVVSSYAFALRRVFLFNLVAGGVAFGIALCVGLRRFPS